MGLGDLATLLSAGTKSAGKASQQAARASAAKRAVAAPKAAAKAPVAPAKLPSSGPFSRIGPDSALAGAPKLERTFKATPTPRIPASSSHSLFSLHTLEDVASQGADLASQGFHELYPKGAPAGTKGAIKADGGATVAAINPGKTLSVLATAAKNTPGSALRTVTGTVPGLVATGKALVDAAEGHPQGLEAIGKGILDIVKHPVASFEKEPVPVGLMLAGGEGAAGRLAGAAMRSGALGDRAAEIASMDRAPLHVIATSTGGSSDQITAGMHDVLAIPRRYSPDVIRKGAQVAAEKFRARTHDPNIASPEQANRILYGGSLISQHLFKRAQGFFKPGLVDEQAAKGEMLRRMYTKAAAHTMHEIKPKVGAEAVPLAVEGILRRPDTVQADLQKELGRLRSASDGLTGKELKANRANQKQIEGLLADRKFLADPHPAFEAARQYTSWSAPLEERLVQLGHLEPDQLNAKLVPFALSHMGPDVRYNQTPGAHPLVASVKSADRQVKAASKAVERAISAREDANTLHPKVPNGHPVALAREALRRAEREHSYAEGRSTDLHGGARNTRSPRMLNPAELNGRVPAAQAEYRAAKATLLQERQAAVDEARNRLMDARGAHATLAQDLQGLKHAGAIKPNGDMWARLEKAGQPLRPDTIRTLVAHELGDRGVGFLTHKQDQTYGKLLESYAGKRPGTETRSRSGVSFQHGVYDRSYAALARQAYRHANAIAGHENRDEMLRRFGIGRFHTIEEAQRAADNFHHTPEGERIATALGKLEPQLIGPDRVIAQRNVETRALGPILRDFGLAEHKAVTETADAPKYTLLPDAVSKRIGEHDKLNQASQGKRLLQWYTNKWRSAALFTSPRWLMGNPQEHSIRLAWANVNPAAIFGIGPAAKLGHRIIDHWHSVMADQSHTEAQRYVARAHVGAYAAGTHYGSIAVNAIRRGAEDAPASDFAQALSETGPMSKISGAWQKWKGVIGHGMAAVERNSKAAAVGKAALNETHKFTADWRALIGRQDTAVRKFAEGKLSPNEASKLGNDVMEMMGNWSQLTPAVRNAVQTWSPFGLWWLTSMKFVFRALPRDHPMKTAALAAMESATHTASQEASTPAYLQGGVKANLPIVGDVTLTPEYYSPFGVAVDPGVTAMGQILPQLTDPYLTARGVNPVTNEAIKDANRKPLDPGHLSAQALYGVLEGLVPGARQAVQLAQEGGRPEPGSFSPLAVQPGTKRGLDQTLVKLFSPVRYTPGKRGGKSAPASIKPGLGKSASMGKSAGLGKAASLGKAAGP